jgi:uncharacterized protein (DUF608 family)
MPRVPVLTRYDEDHLNRIALPLGGIGTGTVSLGGRGDLRDWEIVNRPAKGFTPVVGFGGGPFFSLYLRDGDRTHVRAVEGPIAADEYEGASGSRARNHGLPRFRHATFAAAYPFGEVTLGDPDVPVTVRLEAFNPLIPGDADASGLPVAVLRYVVVNETDREMRASVCGTVPNFVGSDGSPGCPGPKANRNAFRKSKDVSGILMTSDGVDLDADQAGSIALTTTATDAISYRTAWARLSWGNSLLDFWDDFSDDGALDEREGGGTDAPIASLASSFTVPPRSEATVTFLLTWRFPNRRTWTPAPDAVADIVGNYYATRFGDAFEVAEHVATNLPALESGTRRFVETFCGSDLPVVVAEAALFNLSTLRSQTCFRTSDGRFFGFEGCHDGSGCCHGSCTHVWNYEQATAFLFGDLARSMRETEYGKAVRENGLMSFRVNLPLARSTEFAHAAADGQMGCLMKLYRDWQLSGDDGFLRSLWAQARRSLEFCWLPGGWDADVDGVMEGCQHNTMDVEYYGPNPQMGAWYLGALRASEEMARYLGETDFADTCRRLFENGSRWLDENLFNGEYYEHRIVPPSSESAVADGLRVGMGAQPGTDPDLQLGSGCLVDQLVGQFLAHVCGLGYLLDRNHVRTTLASIRKHNFRTNFYSHFNHLRSFVVGDESGLLMATYPRGRRPKRPFPYYNEVMTGFEYAAAAHMLYEGQTETGLECIAAIRARYDGRKRNPFDEAECGHHYARAMASWGAVLAWTGFGYSGVEKRMTFGSRDGSHFWSNGAAWGSCAVRATDSGVRVTLSVAFGSLELASFRVEGVGETRFDGGLRLLEGGSATFDVERNT